MAAADLHTVESGPLPYLLSIPAAPASGSSEVQLRPVLCFLHGYDEGPPLAMRRALTRHGPLRSGSAPQATSDFVVAAPQLPRRGDLWHRYAEAVHQIATSVQERHRGDPARMYLSGFSFGGNGVFDLARSQTDYWAALWPVDPTRVPASAPERPLWLSFGAVARRQKRAFIRSLDLQPSREMPHGDRLYRDDGHDHVETARHAYGDARIYHWLLSNHRPLRRSEP